MIRSIRGFSVSIRGIRVIRGSSSLGCGWAALGFIRGYRDVQAAEEPEDR